MDIRNSRLDDAVTKEAFLERVSPPTRLKPRGHENSTSLHKRRSDIFKGSAEIVAADFKKGQDEKAKIISPTNTMLMGIMALIRRADGGSSSVKPAICDNTAKIAQKVHWINNIAIGASKPKDDRTALLIKTIELDTARWFSCFRKGGTGS